MVSILRAATVEPLGYTDLVVDVEDNSPFSCSVLCGQAIGVVVELASRVCADDGGICNPIRIWHEVELLQVSELAGHRFDGQRRVMDL